MDTNGSPLPETWSLVTVSATGRNIFCAALGENGVREVPSLKGYAGVFEALQDWESLAPALRSYDPRQAAPVSDARLLAPVRYPRTLVCGGSNYHSHLTEMLGSDSTAIHVPPYFFIKPATTTVIGPDEPILISADPAQQVDWEAELGVVIGRGGRDIPVDQALAHVAGYTIVNDISARGAIHRTDAFHEAFAWDWLASKGQDTFCPTGPGVTPEWLVPDPQDLSIVLTVNGRQEQSSNTKEMIRGVAELISLASAMVRLQPGDLLATGTPAGVGAGKGRFLRPGDTVEISIAGLGRLRNPVADRDDSPGA
ncbi:fumarylacetoacetate hydrolase family protein [Streptomyces sp. NPDC058464]|uniref:fumarylacetoacetate hydrolase family protein n=1 Tax=Streptomyces sp. NPDC058464 TaxID=3346511 RepID=UPI00365F6E83